MAEDPTSARTPENYPPELSAPARFIAAASSHPSSTAVHIVDQDRDITYSELLGRCVSTAVNLGRLIPGRDGGESTDDTIAIGCVVDEGVELVVAEMAILMAGAILVPMDSTFPMERLSFIADDAGVKLIIARKHAADAFKFKLEATRNGSSTDSGLRKPPVKVVAFEDVEQGLTTAIDPEDTANESDSNDEGVDLFAESDDVDDDAAERLQGLSLNSNISSSALDVSESIKRLPKLRMDSASHVVYTSGSTGLPKGIVCLHAGMGNYVAAKNRFHEIAVGSRVLLASASTWDPSLGDIFPTLGSGATLCVAPRAMVIHDLAGTLRRSRATHVFATPALWSLINAAPASIPDLKVVALGGEPIPQSVRSTWAEDLRLINTYGVTEATICQTAITISKHVEVNNIGAPLAGCLVHIDHATEDEGDAGELLVGGIQVGRCYLNSPENTQEKFCDINGLRWVRTGDLARINEKGEVLILGRKDNQVKIRGFRIELEEVEAVLCRSDLVNSALVTKFSTASGVERLVGYITLSTNEEAFFQGGEYAVRLHCCRLLPAHALPTQLVPLPSLPLTATGKASRKLLPPPPPLKPRAHVDPSLQTEGAKENQLRTDIELLVAKVWEETLEIAGIGPHDNFFELGGTSLAQTQMILKLSELLPLNDSTKHAAFMADADHIKVRFCGLQKRPTLREYASLLEWAALAAPNRSEEDSKSFSGLFKSAIEPKTGEELLTFIDEDDQSDVSVAVAALNTSAKYGHSDVVKNLLKLNISPDGRVSRFNKANSPLMIAALNDNPAVVEVLISAGANLQLTNSAQAAAAHMAAIASPTSLDHILKAGGSNKVRDLNKWTPLHHACWTGNDASIDVLVDAGAPLGEKDRWSRTPIAWAIYANHVSAVEKLLASGAPLYADLEKGQVPQMSHQRRTDNVWIGCLHMAAVNACKLGDCRVLNALINNGISLDERDANNGTALHTIASYDKELDSIDTPCTAANMLLEAGCPIDALDADGNTALHLTVAPSRRTKQASLSLYKLLQDKGADGTIANKEGLAVNEIRNT